MTAKKSNQVAQLPTHAGTEMSVHPGQMIEALMKVKDLDVARLEKMFELQERYEDNSVHQFLRDGPREACPATQTDSGEGLKDVQQEKGAEDGQAGPQE